MKTPTRKKAAAAAKDRQAIPTSPAPRIETAMWLLRVMEKLLGRVAVSSGGERA